MTNKAQMIEKIASLINEKNLTEFPTFGTSRIGMECGSFST